jgi:hypothetical protein
MLSRVRFPQQFASFGIDSKDVGAHIAKQCRPAIPPCDDANRCTHFEVRIEYPSDTPSLSIEREDLAAGAAYKDASADDGWLGKRAGISRKRKSPFQFETRDVVRRQLRHRRWLEAVL